MTKQDYVRLIQNSEAEIAMRIQAVSKQYRKYSIQELTDEVDTIINRVRQIKLAIIFLRNTENAVVSG